MKWYIQETKWKQIFAFLKSMKGIHTKDKNRLRRFMKAIWYIARSGCQWRLLPKIYGNYRSIHRRFKKWCEKGIWAKLFEYTQQDPDLEVHIIDGTTVRAHACAAGYGKDSGAQEALGRSKGGFTTKIHALVDALGNPLIDGTTVRAHACAAGYGKDSGAQEALGRSKGGFTTKIHALVDALGNPLKFILTPGQRNEITQAEALTKNVSNSFVVADKSYDRNAFVANLEDKKCEVVIPPKRNRKVQRFYDKHIYKERHLIECFFGKIKNFRRIFSRFDKTAEVFMGFLNFVGALIWLL